MKSLYIFSVICCTILPLTFLNVNAQKTVTYRVEYNDDNDACEGTNLQPLTINSSFTSTAMDIMELARDEGREYNFSATYFGFLGYFIDSVNGRPGENDCFWFFYIQAPGGSAFKPQIGVTTYVPGDNFVVILRYETFRQPAMFSSNMTIEYPEAACSTATPPPDAAVSIVQGGTALDVMEQAGNMGSDYRFSATYFGSGLGFFIDTLNGVSNNQTNACNWLFFIMTPDGAVEQASVGVSNYIVPADDSTVVWRYMNASESMETMVPSPLAQVDAEKTVTYRVEYNDDNVACSGTNLQPLTIGSSFTSTAMDIMELARDQGEEYQFSATYFGASIGGYFIDSVNGRLGENDCFWFFYIQAPGGSAFKPQIGVTTYVPGDNFVVILRYETFRQPAMFSSNMIIEYPEPTCSTATPPPDAAVSIVQGGTALDVMEQAGNMGSNYRFSATYFGSDLGFFIDTLNGVSSNVEENCFWLYFIMTPNGIIEIADLGVSNYVIPGDGYTIIWRYVNGASHVAQDMKVLILANLLLFVLLKQF